VLLVPRVADGSPAANAGLQPDDVIVTYDDQKIYSPIQLGRLVRNDKPGQEVTLGIVRAGESNEVKVQIGDLADTNATRELESLSSQRPRRLRTATEEVDETWSSFDSLTLERQGKDSFKAAIKYRTNAGQITSRDFQGSIEDICKDVAAQHDMPVIERQHLLCALNASEKPIEFAGPSPRMARITGANSKRWPEREEVNWTFAF
jgi:hypothetical protein